MTNELNAGAKAIEKFAEFTPLDKRKLPVKKLGVRVEAIFPDVEVEEMADNQKKNLKSCKCLYFMWYEYVFAS